MMRSLHRSSISLAIAVLAAGMLGAAEPAKLSYTRDVQPILAANCFLCHGPDAGNRKAGLRLDLAADAAKALKSGDRAIVPGHPEKSALIERINAEGSERMPPPKMPKG